MQVSSATLFDIARDVAVDTAARGRRALGSIGHAASKLALYMNETLRSLSVLVRHEAEHVARVLPRGADATAYHLPAGSGAYDARPIATPLLPGDAVWAVATDAAQSALMHANVIDDMHAAATTHVDAAAYAFDRMIADLAPIMAVGPRGRGEVLPLVTPMKPKAATGRAEILGASRAA